MSKSWSEIIESVDLSTKPSREPRKLSCDEITDLKEKCNPKYDLTILDLICTIEALQHEKAELIEIIDRHVLRKMYPAKCTDKIQVFENREEYDKVLKLMWKLMKEAEHDEAK